MSGKSSSEQIVELTDQLVALRFPGNGTVAALFEKPCPGVHRPRDSVQVLEGVGFAGDHPRKSFWRGRHIPGREVSACSAEVLEILGVDPAVVGDNLITRGIDLGSLEPGTKLRIGEVILARSPREHTPCATFRARTSDTAFTLAVRGYRGALFIVLQSGYICIDDRIDILAMAEASQAPAREA